MNKYLGAAAGALGVFVAIAIVTEGIYGAGHGGGHGDGAPEFYYASAEPEDEVVEEEAPVDFAPLIAAASIEDGETIFGRKCASCHKIDEGAAHGVGPALHGVMGRQIAAAEGYRYSSALNDRADLVWDWEAMAGFLTRPSKWAPGTKMGFAGFKKPEDVAAVMIYLNEHTGAPLDPPSEEQASAE